MHNRLLSGLLLLAVSSPLALAQEPVERAAPAAPVISVDFPGGTLSDLLAAMRRIDPRLNITASALAREVKMPELSVKGAEVINVLEAASAIAPQDFSVSCHASGRDGATVYMVMVRQTQPPGMAHSSRGARDVQVFSLRSLIEAQPGDDPKEPMAVPVDTVLSALEAGLGMTAGDAATLKYHHDSMLLFIDGNPAQVSVVQQVLTNLQRDQQEGRKNRDRERKLQDSLRREAAKAADPTKTEAEKR